MKKILSLLVLIVVCFLQVSADFYKGYGYRINNNKKLYPINVFDTKKITTESEPEFEFDSDFFEFEEEPLDESSDKSTDYSVKWYY